MKSQGLLRRLPSLGGHLSRRMAISRLAEASAMVTLASAGFGTTSSLAEGTTPLVRSTVSTKGRVMSQATPAADAPLTVVLVHGAFADASSWYPVAAELQTAGVNVLAPANPLRGVSSDAAYIASVVNQIPGPVLLVGHSYGGMVMSNAATQTPNVVGLVFVAAFIPEEGESIQSLAEQAMDSKLGAALLPAQYPSPDSGEPGVEFYIDPAKFHDVFCADLPAEQAAVLAISQRPGSGVGFGEPSGPVAWKTLPSWAVITPSDWTIGPSGERLMAERAGAEITEIEASHVVMLSQPQAVTEVILSAIEALG